MTLIDRKAPAFDLEGSDGKRHRLEDYAGKRILLFFYPRDNTPGCTKEATGFRNLKPKFDELGFVMLGISRDSLASHQRFIDAHDLNMVLLSDPDASVMKAYHAFGEKTMYGKIVSGVIRSTLLICADGVVRKHWTKIAKAEHHPAQVLEYIKDFHCE
jgi:thioredoxin-dependent peroxiredoxin